MSQTIPKAEAPEANVDRDGSTLEKAEPDSEQSQGVEKYPPLRIALPTMLSLFLAFFLAALDRTIIGVAIPAISDDLNSFQDISWYEAAFLFASCITQMPFGKIYTYFSTKWTTFVVIVIFEVGSVVCATAQSSVAFIIGRAITGIGVSGLSVAIQVALSALVPVRQRPAYQSGMGACFGLSSILGPLVGGLFVSGSTTWRWCFWISLPVGGLALAGIVFVMPNFPPPAKLEGSWSEIFKQFDPIGNALLIPGVICLLLALQWGGLRYPWDSARVLALLVVGVVLVAAFAISQWFLKHATISRRVLCQRSIASGVVVSIGIGSIIIIVAFYLPIWFQAIKGISARDAGVRLLPFFLGTVIFVIVSGIAISKGGYYNPWLIGGVALLSVGLGLMTTFTPESGPGKWIGYQVIVGVGFGLSLQQVLNAAQIVLAKEDIPAGVTLLTFAQNLGGTIFISVSQTLLANELSSELATKLPGFDATMLISTGATAIRDLVSEQDLPVVLSAYNNGIVDVFYLALGLALATFLASFFLEWRTVQLADQRGEDDKSPTQVSS